MTPALDFLIFTTGDAFEKVRWVGPFFPRNCIHAQNRGSRVPEACSWAPGKGSGLAPFSPLFPFYRWETLLGLLPV